MRNYLEGSILWFLDLKVSFNNRPYVNEKYETCCISCNEIAVNEQIASSSSSSCIEDRPSDNFWLSLFHPKTNSWSTFWKKMDKKRSALLLENVTLLTCSSWAKLTNIGMMSDLTNSISTALANSPSLAAAARRTIGVSSWHNVRNWFRRSAGEGEKRSAYKICHFRSLKTTFNFLLCVTSKERTIVRTVKTKSCESFAK